MAGTKTGGLKARETNFKKHGADFYKRIGAEGGRNGHGGGFADDHERASTAGARGGSTTQKKWRRMGKDADGNVQMMNRETGEVHSVIKG